MSTTTRPRSPQVRAALGPDAELIQLCDWLAANGEALEALLETQHTIEDEERGKPAVDAFYADREKLLDGIWRIEVPRTLDGAKAMARAFSAIASRDRDGTIMEGGQTWIAFNICDFLAERPAQPAPTSEEQEKIKANVAALAAKIAAMEAEQAREMAESHRRTSIETMTRAELEWSLDGMRGLHELAQKRLNRMIERLAEVVA